jgi:hypothetical protein
MKKLALFALVLLAAGCATRNSSFSGRNPAPVQVQATDSGATVAADVTAWESIRSTIAETPGTSLVTLLAAGAAGYAVWDANKSSGSNDQPSPAGHNNNVHAGGDVIIVTAGHDSGPVSNKPTTDNSTEAAP